MKELKDYEYTGRKFLCIRSVFMDDDVRFPAFTQQNVYEEAIPNEYPVSDTISQICLIDDSNDMHFVNKENSKWFVDHFRDGRPRAEFDVSEFRSLDQK